MKNLILIIFKGFIVFSFCFIYSCINIPEENQYKETEKLPDIFPDYNEVTIPPNIAPLNFIINDKAKKYIVSISSEKGKTLKIKSNSKLIKINQKDWRELLTQNKGKEISILVYLKEKNENWIKYKPLTLKVAEYDIDEYLVYRIINVGYVLWKKMGIYQRNLTNFDETPIMLNRNTNDNCMNCHSFCNNNPNMMMFHMRGDFSGTVISLNDSIFKINSKTPYTMTAGAYPYWHPDGEHIAFSVNIVKQWFHAVEERNEVFDRASDLIVYNIKTNTITTSPKISTKNRETLPTWSPDGKYLYYCSAPEMNDTLKYNEVKYDLLKISYNTHTNEWGEVDTVLLASEAGKSISYPRISPDGKYIIFCLATHGYFTIYNKTSELYIMNLETKEYLPFAFNSNAVDSYHTWSKNGRWFVFSSKRIDDLCSRPFICYFDENGKTYKPFVLPQKDPQFYNTFIKNYNVPELV
ncbi:MAG: PD40 domain-containing protein, partial [Bacteroidales bacterium]|nr:PD40 domain-containing protein [Bacteroidales bacterium]